MNNKKSFDWKTYIKELPDSPLLIQKWEQEFIQMVSEKITEGKINRILEVGCSNGRWLRWFKEKYHCEVWGIDKEEVGIRDDMGLVKFAIGDALTMPYKNNLFDVVLSLGLIEHFTKKEKYQILREQNRVLRDGGYLICQAPLLSFFSFNFFYMKYFYDYRKGTKHFRTTKGELKNYLRNLGLKIIFDGFTGSLLELSPYKKMFTFSSIKCLFATEVLIICKK